MVLGLSVGSFVSPQSLDEVEESFRGEGVVGEREAIKMGDFKRVSLAVKDGRASESTEVQEGF